jgi:hypothetical protein
MCSSKKGISTRQIQQTVGCGLKTAWFLTHRIRECMKPGVAGDDLPPLGGEGEVVESDETYIGTKKAFKKRHGGGAHKNVVLSLVERGGSVRSFHINRASVPDILPIVRENVAKETRLHTDEARHYERVGTQFAAHETVNHAAEEYARGDVTTNSVEGFFSVFKHGMLGICWTMARPETLWRTLAHYGRSIGRGLRAAWRWIARRDHRGRQARTQCRNRHGVAGCRPVDRGERIDLAAIQSAFDKLPANIRSNGMRSSSVPASAIIRAFLGDEWFDRHVVPNARTSGFVTVDESSQIGLDLSFYRLIDLSELLFNLQHVLGFDDCLSRMKAGDIEGTFAELDLGRMLFWHHVQFRYVRPSGIKGYDYDVDIAYPNGLFACGDAKCKIEGTDFNAKSIRNSLDAARKQLPDGRPGIVFVKIPPRWMREREFVRLSTSTALDFLRSIRRVVSVKILYLYGCLFGWLGKD